MVPRMAMAQQRGANGRRVAVGKVMAVAVTLLAASGLAGCERAKPQAQPQPPGPQPSPTRMVGDAATSDAAPSPPDAGRVTTHADAATSDAAPQDLGPEPKEPPPPPTVKKQTKGDCQLAYAPRPTRDPNPVCKIAGGTFLMGSAAPDAAANEKPVRKVTLTPYFIDQFEVTNAQVVHFLNAVGNQCPSTSTKLCFDTDENTDPAEILVNNGRYAVRKGHEREPIRTATVEGAERYCAWVGKRLPTEAEWEFAARHDPKSNQDYRWPWGDTFLPKRAACDEAICKDGFKRIFQKYNTSDQAPVGTFDGTRGFGDGSSPWGVHDLAGNVSEIMADTTDSRATPYPDCGACIDPETPATAQRIFHIVRGPSAAAVTNDASIAVRRGGAGVHIEGFRCAYR